jgi:GntR family transcriptional regulator
MAERKDSDSVSGVRGISNRPLYAQVREILLERIYTGVWRPGDLVPNEFAIAADLGVSQGTIRKAQDSLAADHVLVRKQGRGTYVARHTPDEMLFRFFNFFDAQGRRAQPDSCNVERTEGLANEEERARLALEADERVFRISRVRTIGGAPFIIETIILPQRLFAGLPGEADLPNTLYDHFQKVYGITISRGTEKLSAAVAGPIEAETLSIEEGTPLLKLDRIVYSLQNTPVEWRLSLCRTDQLSYIVELGARPQ